MDLLKDVPTKDLVNELMGREGVKTEIIGMEEEYQASLEGPAIVLIVID